MLLKIEVTAEVRETSNCKLAFESIQHLHPSGFPLKLKHRNLTSSSSDVRCTYLMGYWPPADPYTCFSFHPPPGCTLNRQDVRLTLHYEKGFTVTREPADPAGGAVLYRYPYEKLKMSADDGIRNLYLDFGGPEGEMVRAMKEGSCMTLMYDTVFITNLSTLLPYIIHSKQH